ncbi:MAG: hypothetical protein Q9226_004823 [Calogaya cf. arnoldii]
MDFQPESVATLMEKDATTVCASYRELSAKYDSLVDDLEFANKRTLMFQRRNQELESAMDLADNKTAAISKSLAELEAELAKSRSTVAALQSASRQEHVPGKIDFKAIAREEAWEKNESEQILYESILKGLQPFLLGKNLFSKLSLYKSILKGLQPFLVGKDLFFQDGAVSQSEPDQPAPTSAPNKAPFPTQNAAALYQPRIKRPRGVTRSEKTWGPLPDIG